MILLTKEYLEQKASIEKMNQWIDEFEADQATERRIGWYVGTGMVIFLTVLHWLVG